MFFGGWGGGVFYSPSFSLSSFSHNSFANRSIASRPRTLSCPACATCGAALTAPARRPAAPPPCSRAFQTSPPVNRFRRPAEYTSSAEEEHIRLDASLPDSAPHALIRGSIDSRSVGGYHFLFPPAAQRCTCSIFRPASQFSRTSLGPRLSADPPGAQSGLVAHRLRVIGNDLEPPTSEVCPPRRPDLA